MKKQQYKITYLFKIKLPYAVILIVSKYKDKKIS